MLKQNKNILNLLKGKLFFLLFSFALPFASQASCTYYSPNETYTPPPAAGTTYIIDGTNGQDPADCRLPGSTWGTVGNTPYKTIACAMNRYVARTTPRFLIHAGKYNERFTINENWVQGNDESHRSVVAAYGDGEVIVDGSVSKDLGDWSIYSGQIYQATFSVAPVNGLVAVVIDDNFRSYLPAASLAEVTGPGKWFYDSSSSTLYLWPASDIVGSPSGHDIVAVEKDVDGSSKYGIYIKPGAKYWTISGLTIRGNPGGNIFADGVSPFNDHITITNNKIEYSAKAGIWLNGSTNSLVTKNYLFGNVLRNWPRGMWASNCPDYTAGGWPPSIAMISNTNHLVENNVVSWSNGEGIIFIDNGKYGNGIGSNNIVHDSYSTNMYFDHGLNSTFEANLVYSSTPLEADIRQTGCSASDITALTRKSRAAGINSANEAYTSNPPIGSGNNIYNNIILNTRKGLGNGDETTGGGLRNENIFNNTVIVPDYDPTAINDALIGISIGYSSGNNLNTNVKNNLVLATNVKTSLVSWEASGNPTDTGITWSNNLYYHPNNATPFTYKGSKYAFSDWLNQTLQDSGALFSNPLLARSNWPNEFTPPSNHTGQCWEIYDYTGIDMNDFKLNSDSPGIDAGADLSLQGISTDFWGNLRPAVNGFDIGAHEFGAVAPPETIPPTISNGIPSGIVAYGTTSATVSVSTDEDATCRFSTQSNQSFSSMSLFESTGGQTHSFNLNVSNGNSYTYYVKCADAFNNINVEDYQVSFRVASSDDSTPPSISFGSPIGNLPAGTSSTTLSLITDENSTCKFGTNPNVAYASMPNMFSTDNGLTHYATLNSLVDGNSYTYYARCKDINGNADTSDYVMNFTVNTSSTTYQQSLYWSGDSDTPNQTLNNTTIAATGTPTYVTGQDNVANGARNLAINNNYITFSKTADFNWQQGKMYFYFYPTSSVTNDIFAFSWATGKNLYFKSDSGGKFYVSYNFDSGSVDRSVSNLAINTWHYVQIEWDLPKHSFVVKIDGADLTLSTSSPSWTVTPATEALYFGRGATYAIYNRSYVDELYFYVPVVDSIAPIISAVSSSDTDLKKTTVSWATDEDATSQIEYGITASYGSTTIKDSSLKKAHSQMLVGLAPGTTYHYRVKSLDAAGNVAYSNDATFTTSQLLNQYSFLNFLTIRSEWLHLGGGHETDFDSNDIVNAKDLGIMMSKWN